MRIDIWSDYVCPFCTIGERHLALALEEFEGRDAVEIVWRGFQLDPDAPREPEGTMVEGLAEKMNISPAKVETDLEGLASRAKNIGLNFNWQEAINANTWDAHRLGLLARTMGVGEAWDHTVKQGFFSQGKNIADHDTLRGFATEVGLSAEAVDRVLGSTEFSDEVNRDIAEAKEIGVQGVPFFVFDGRLALSGAQPVELFTQALAQAAEGK